jgi:hypothetical protein
VAVVQCLIKLLVSSAAAVSCQLTLLLTAAAAEEDAEAAAAKEAPLSLPSAAAMSMGSKRPAVLADGTYASQVRQGTGLSSSILGFGRNMR